MKHVIVNGLDVAYTDQGKGPVVLMVHGWGSNKEAYNGLAQRMSKRFRVICPDLPGFGGSQTPQKAWRLDDFAVFLEDFLKKLSINELHAYVGHSLGGRIGIRAKATSHLPSHKMVLLASHGIASPNSPRNLLYKSIAKTGKAVTRLMPTAARQNLRRKMYERAGSTDYLQVTPAMRQTFKNMISQDLREDATMVTIPTLLIYGTADDQTPPRFGELFAKRMPHATLEVIPDAGHYVHQDALDMVAQKMEKFL